MQSATFTGLLVAVGVGVVVGVQTVFFTLMGRAIGPFKGSLLTSLAGGLLGLVLLTALVLIQGRDQWALPPRITLLHAGIAVVLGTLVVTGIGFAFQRVGVAGGGAAIFVAQMVISMVVDSLGLAGGERIPFDWVRAAGLGVVMIGVLILVLRR
jgi:uncharacterized membrane protein YdcZ (DUF606 family)